jgi:hypothetical protein
MASHKPLKEEDEGEGEELQELAADKKRERETEEDHDEEEESEQPLKEQLQLKARFFNKTNTTVCILWHLLPMIVMVYAFLYIGTTSLGGGGAK